MVAATGTGPTSPEGPIAVTLDRQCSQDELVSRARQGDVEALSSLIERCKGAIVAAIVAVRPPGHIDLGEAAHLARLQILEKFATDYREEGPPCNWMAVVARNRTRDLLRQEGRHVDRSVSIDLVAGPFVDDAAEETTARVDNWDALNRILAELSADDAEVLTLHFLHGLTRHELAERFGYSYEGMRSKITRACARAQAIATTIKEGAA